MTSFSGVEALVIPLIGASAKKILVYVEAEQAVISVSVFFQSEASHRPIFKFGTKALSNHLYAIWNHEPESEPRWRAAHYAITDGHASLHLVPPADFDEEMDDLDRRDNVVANYFGTAEIDYSNPE